MAETPRTIEFKVVPRFEGFREANEQAMRLALAMGKRSEAYRILERQRLDWARSFLLEGDIDSCLHALAQASKDLADQQDRDDTMAGPPSSIASVSWRDPAPVTTASIAEAWTNLGWTTDRPSFAMDEPDEKFESFEPGGLFHSVYETEMKRQLDMQTLLAGHVFVGPNPDYKPSRWARIKGWFRR